MRAAKLIIPALLMVLVLAILLVGRSEGPPPASLVPIQAGSQIVGRHSGPAGRGSLDTTADKINDTELQVAGPAGMNDGQYASEFVENMLDHGWADTEAYRTPRNGGVKLLALTSLTPDAEIQIDAPDHRHWAEILIFGSSGSDGLRYLSAAARRAHVADQRPLVEVVLWNGVASAVRAEPPQT